MKYSVPDISGRRGAGLGNESIPWAKAFLASKALNLKMIDPPWLLNARPYLSELSASRWDSARWLAARNLPSFNVDEETYFGLGSWDYHTAMLDLQKSHHPKAVTLVHSSGMAGGFLAIRRARSFLKSRILVDQSEEFLLHDHQDGVPRIGLHVRGGDFQSEPLQPGVFNSKTPVSWYLENLASLVKAIGGPVDVVIADQDRLIVQGDLPEGVQVHWLRGTSAQDLTALASCDVLLPSISTYSLLSIFLSDCLYAWPIDHLNAVDGWLDIWGHEPRQLSGPTAKARAVAISESFRVQRGIARKGDETWPEDVIQDVRRRANLRVSTSNLIAYGVVRDVPRG